MKRAFLATILVVVSVVFLNLVAEQPAGNDPGPDEDRVHFPKGYRDFKVLYVFDRPDNKQIRVVYGNDQAVLATADEGFPYGSVLVMEPYRALVDEDGQVMLDEQGRFQRGDPIPSHSLFVMRKEKGFGEDYQHNRTGEWEYAQYDSRTEERQIEPRQTANCAKCHLQAGSPKDWVFRSSLFFNEASGALPNNVMQHYTFLPGIIQAQVGRAITWYNDDVIEHRIVLNNVFDSGNMRQGSSFSYIFDEPGEYEYQCRIHPPMKGKIIVKDEKANK